MDKQFHSLFSARHLTVQSLWLLPSLYLGGGLLFMRFCQRRRAGGRNDHCAVSAIFECISAVASLNAQSSTKAYAPEWLNSERYRL